MQGVRGGSAEEGGRRPRMERAWIVIGVVLLGALMLGLLGAIQIPERRADMWFEIVAGSIRVVVLAITGGIVAAVVRDRDAVREDARRRQADAAAFLERIQDTFGQVKSARRMLRTHGFGGTDAHALTDEQVAGFRTQMALLNDADLAFEMYARRVAIMPGPYGDTRDRLTGALTGIHEYLKAILQEWQRDPAAITVGGDAVATREWARFGRFVGYDDEAAADFRANLADPMVTIEVAIGAAGQAA